MKSNQGYIAITTVLIVLAVTIGITSALFFLSSGNIKIAESLRQGERALFRSDGCLEEGLLRLKADPLYAGGVVSFPDGTCHISIEKQAEIYVFQVIFSNNDPYWRSIEARAQITDGVVQLTSWSEKPLVVE
jgi:hypothetical protein